MLNPTLMAVRPTQSKSLSLGKIVAGTYRVAIVPTKPGSMHANTLHRLLSVKQSGLGRSRLLRLIERHGLG